MAHRKMDEEEKKENRMPRVSIDYFFMSRKDEEAKDNPLIVMIDEKTGDPREDVDKKTNTTSFNHNLHTRGHQERD